MGDTFDDSSRGTAARCMTVLGATALVIAGLAGPARAGPTTCKTTLLGGQIVGLPYASGQGNIIGGVRQPTVVDVGQDGTQQHQYTPGREKYQVFARTSAGNPISSPFHDGTSTQSGWLDDDSLDWTKQFTKCIERRSR